MDEQVLARARARGGVVLGAEAGSARAARRAGLVLVQPRAYVAATQPVDAAVIAEAVRRSVPDDEWAFAGCTALWRYGVLSARTPVEVGVPDTRQLVLGNGVRVRRLASGLLTRCRTLGDWRLVSVETAVVQAAEVLAAEELSDLLETALRGRLTTHDRLLASCRRGVKGSSALRAALAPLSDGDLELQKRRLRRALEQAGVTGLHSEVPVTSASGAVVYLDLLHEASRNVVEVDGFASHSDRRRFLADRRRDRWLRRERGLLTTRVAAVEVRDRLPAVVQELVPLLVTSA